MREEQHLPLKIPVTTDALKPCLARGQNWGFFPVEMAAMTGDIEALRALLEIGADPNRVTKKHTPIMYLVEYVTPQSAARNEACFKLLLEYGADVHRQSSSLKWTALHFATTGGYGDPIRWLVAHGADVNARDTLGRTPLHWAAENSAKGFNHEGMLQLVELGADCAVRDNDGKTPVDLARFPERRIALQAACDSSATNPQRP